MLQKSKECAYHGQYGAVLLARYLAVAEIPIVGTSESAGDGQITLLLSTKNVAKRITRYLAGTLDYGLCYGPKDVSRGMNPEGKLIGWTDSSWADCKDTSRVTSGYVY